MIYILANIMSKAKQADYFYVLAAELLCHMDLFYR